MRAKFLLNGKIDGSEWYLNGDMATAVSLLYVCKFKEVILFG
jgi:hypothetical protein